MIAAGPGARTDAQVVYAQLRAQILAGTLPPGTPLREIALAGQFGVSRTPVEAVRAHDEPAAREIAGAHMEMARGIRLALLRDAAAQ